MIRHNPSPALSQCPCSVVAVASALGHRPEGEPQLRADGYATLAAANKFIRANLPVKRRKDYKRGERPTLRDLNYDGKAIVCVLGHYIYLDGDDYYSFFDNDNDDVVAVWELGDKKIK